MRDRVPQAIGALVIVGALLGLIRLAQTSPSVHPLAITAWRTQSVPSR